MLQVVDNCVLRREYCVLELDHILARRRESSSASSLVAMLRSTCMASQKAGLLCHGNAIPCSMIMLQALYEAS